MVDPVSNSNQVHTNHDFSQPAEASSLDNKTQVVAKILRAEAQRINGEDLSLQGRASINGQADINPQGAIWAEEK